MSKFLAAIAVAGALFVGSASAHAAVILGTGNPGNEGTENVLFNSCSGSLTQSGSTLVQGCLNGSPTTIVNFESNEEIQAGAGGQARVEAADGAFDNLAIYLDDPTLTFEKLILNLNVEQGDSGTIVFTVFLSGGGSEVFAPQAVAQGQNFFSFTTTDGDKMTKVSFASSIGIDAVLLDDVRQVRLGGVEGPDTNVPEPATLGLLGLGLLGLGYAVRRRRQV